MRRFIIGCVLLIATAGMTGLHLVRRAEARQPSFRIEVLKGNEARVYLARKIASNPKFAAAYAKAGQNLRARGYHRTNNPTFQRTLHVKTPKSQGIAERLIEKIFPTVYAQYYEESTNDGEAFFDPWDDGDDVTWEGTFYVERYSDGAWSMYDWQNDTRNDTDYQMYSVDHVGGEHDHEPFEVRRRGGFLQRLVDLVETPVHASFWGRARDFGRCYASTCLGAATACALSGPAWGGCTAAWCTGDAVGCGIAAFLL